jgi:hypothetical protein
MVEVLEVSEGMAEEIVGLLRGFNNEKMTDEAWRSIFEYPWRERGEPAGYVLSDRGKLAGFLGTIFSRVPVDGKPEPLCNISSWFVKPEYRSRGGELLVPLLRRRDVTITNLSSAARLEPGMRQLGFETLEDASVVVSPLGALPDAWKAGGLRLIRDPETLRRHLSAEEQRIFHDHAKYPCRHLVVLRGNESCYLVYNVKQSDRYRYAYVHYLSNADFYARYAGHLCARLYLAERLARLACDSRLLRGRTVRRGKLVPLTVPRLYRPARVPREDIPNVYSELVMLSL